MKACHYHQKAVQHTRIGIFFRLIVGPISIWYSKQNTVKRRKVFLTTYMLLLETKQHQLPQSWDHSWAGS